jgi:AraC-like DNA-binding protein
MSQVSDPGKTNVVEGCRTADRGEQVSALNAQEYASVGLTISGCRRDNLLRPTELRPGFWVSVMDVRPEQTLHFHYEKSNALVQFGFVLSGHMRNRVRGFPAMDWQAHTEAGTGGVSFLPEIAGSVEIPARQRFQILHLHVEPRLLRSLLRDAEDNIPADFRSVLEGTGSGGYVRRGRMDAAVRTTAYQLACGPAPGLPGRLFLEGKALELLALQMGWMAEGGKPSGRRTLLSPDQRERIHAAREILLRDPASPPTLPQLARRVGLGVNKLVGGFRELFGTTVYGQLQEHRMQQARLLFEQGELNVSQVAWSVGYTNISHFSAAYKKRFGVLPKTFLQSARRRNLAD